MEKIFVMLVNGIVEQAFSTSSNIEVVVVDMDDNAEEPCLFITPETSVFAEDQIYDEIMGCAESNGLESECLKQLEFFTKS